MKTQKVNKAQVLAVINAYQSLNNDFVNVTDADVEELVQRANYAIKDDIWRTKCSFCDTVFVSIKGRPCSMCGRFAQ